MFEHDVWYPVYATPGKGVTNVDLNPLIPEHWANESIAILIENMVIGNLVHRDFSREFARYGDIVNTRKPGEFTAKRKIDSEEVDVQDPTSTNIPVPMNQHFHVSFYIKDGEETMAFKDLVAEYLEPAVVAIAQAIDRVLLGQVYQFEASASGHLDSMIYSNSREYVLKTRKIMNTNKAYVTGRNLILGPDSETTLLLDDTFTSAEKVGDEGTALREASLGRKLGFDIYMSQNVPEFVNTDKNTGTTTSTTAAAGSNAITLTATTNAHVGDMITVADDMTPYRITAVDASTDVITVTPNLRNAIGSSKTVTIYSYGQINQSSTSTANGGDGTNDGYREGWHGKIILDTLATTTSISVGMGVVISGKKYAVIEVVSTGTSTATVILDRPLEAAVADNDIVSLYPSGRYNFAFHKNALALVTRPLKAPRPGTGALSTVVDYNNIAIRSTITYDGKKQGHLVTVDLLCGVKVLDTALGCVMYA